MVGLPRRRTGARRTHPRLTGFGAGVGADRDRQLSQIRLTLAAS